MCTAKSDTLCVIKVLGVIGLDDECLSCVLRGVAVHFQICAAFDLPKPHNLNNSFRVYIQGTG